MKRFTEPDRDERRDRDENLYQRVNEEKTADVVQAAREETADEHADYA
ncbi:hypothetical protein HYG81_21690 (plasmid) [Natrinema zhouii]|nr:hypothetical protein [Natrinema zhouii]UHQ98595.1 hypothetical protein HYG81_21690 [Natrinema zhouii]